MAGLLFLITGGSGFLGINLCRYLLARGHRVRSLDIAPFNYPERCVVESILGDVRIRDTVANAMRDVDVVVHAAAALPLSPIEDIQTTDSEGARIILDISVHFGYRYIV